MTTFEFSRAIWRMKDGATETGVLGPKAQFQGVYNRSHRPQSHSGVSGFQARSKQPIQHRSIQQRKLRVEK